MSFHLQTLTIIISFSTLLISCKSPPSPTTNKTTTFSDYPSAETWIKQNHQAQTITPDSSFCKKIEYYPTSNIGYLIIYPHSPKTPTLIYQNITPQLWTALKKADSKGKFYNKNIQGIKTFTLELKK
jgi:hypothetical protein